MLTLTFFLFFLPAPVHIEAVAGTGMVASGEKTQGYLITVYKYLKNCHVEKEIRFVLCVSLVVGSIRKNSPQYKEGLSHQTKNSRKLSRDGIGCLGDGAYRSSRQGSLFNDTWYRELMEDGWMNEWMDDQNFQISLRLRIYLFLQLRSKCLLIRSCL